MIPQGYYPEDIFKVVEHLQWMNDQHQEKIKALQEELGAVIVGLPLSRILL